ncbi:monovalent cation:proton antiporter-2 (CPA2) family protein [Pyruvatibacter mobilis]|uniref:monovalent cation:proton antiporter-2 (CPA2) family protein n=1 Tax=Pyruvatibacter mobilis TaxID=1712261 RepID=UPI003D116ABA
MEPDTIAEVARQAADMAAGAAGMGEDGHGAAGHATVPYIREMLVFLVASVLLVPLFRWFKASPVLGYLFVGAIIGPFGFAIIDDVDGVARMAELGVVFLLFMIGLELSVERLKAMRTMVFGLGFAQVIVSGAVIGAVALWWGNSVQASIIIGLCLALSSTAVVMQLLMERGEFASRMGRTGFAILLAQDLAVVPLLMLVTIFAAGESGHVTELVGTALLRAVLAVVVIIVAGRWLVRHLYRMVTWTQSPELFMALTLLAVLGTAWFTGLAGLSMALGAFLAGLLLSETEFRHQVETDIEPFKGLLLGLFFISIGMQINFGVLAETWVNVTIGVVGLIVLKFLILTALVKAFSLPLSTSLRTGLLLAAGGEFAFVGVTAAMGSDIISEPVGQYMLIVAAVSMAMTPFLADLGTFLKRKLDDRTGGEPIQATGDEARGLEGHVIIAGYGRVGQTVAKMLGDLKHPYMALDLNVPRTRDCRARGEPVYYGDAAKPDVLERVGGDHAGAVVITLDNFAAASRAVEATRERWPSIPIFVRAWDMTHSDELLKLGATGVVPETLESSLQLAGQVLESLGTPREAVGDIITRIRNRDYADVHPDDPADATGQGKAAAE